MVKRLQKYHETKRQKKEIELEDLENSSSDLSS
jgi:signal transduction histidine kinase